MAFLDRLSGLFGTDPIPQGGVMGEPQVQQMYNPKLAMASQLLAGSNSGKGFGEIMANALMAGQQARQMAAQQMSDQKKLQMDEQLKQAQIQKLQQPDEGPASVQEYQYAVKNGFQGSYQDWLAQGNQQTRPAELQVMDWYEKATPEQRTNFDRLHGREQSPYFQFVQRVLPDGSTQQGTFNARTGESHWTEAPVPAGTKPRVDAAGKTAGEAQAAAAADLPRIVDNASQASRAIDSLLTDPAAHKIFGVQGAFPNVPGGKAAGAQSKFDQIQGQTFLEAYNALKGGGQITEIEGTKATAAINRLKKNLSWSDARTALSELKDVIDAGVRRAQSKASGTTGTINRSPRVRVDEKGNVIGD